MATKAERETMTRIEDKLDLILRHMGLAEVGVEAGKSYKISCQPRGYELPLRSLSTYANVDTANEDVEAYFSSRDVLSTFKKMFGVDIRAKFQEYALEHMLVDDEYIYDYMRIDSVWVVEV